VQYAVWAAAAARIYFMSSRGNRHASDFVSDFDLQNNAHKHAMTPIWKHRSTWVFFTIAFGVPWCGWTTGNALAVHGYNGALLKWLFYTGDFCSVAGFLATYVDEGGTGIKDLIRHCIRWRSPVGWWLYAVFLPVLWAASAVVM